MVSGPVSHLTGIEGASVSAFAVERGRCDEDPPRGATRLGDVLASHDPDRALAPASNAKLVTSALALDALGADYRFETRVVGRGSLDGDRLEGSLVLRGSGAPDLGREDLDALADAVAERVSEVRGDLLLDGRRFAGGHLGPGWTWGDEQHAYGARSSALAVDRNAVEVRIEASDEVPARGSRVGDAPEPEVAVAPDSEEVTVRSDLEVDDDTDEEVRVFTDHETDAVRVEGTLPAGAERTERAPVARPERHCGAVFRDALSAAGVTVGGEVRVAGPSAGSGPEAFARRVRSAPVADLLRGMNVSSDNFVAEQLARTVAAERGDGSWDAWAAVATDFLDDCGAGACRLRDGSGLSRYDLLTARGLVGVLARADAAPWGEAFFDSLPAPGEGTLEGRLGDVPGVRAKTGTITGTSALSGVVRRPERPDVLFSVLFGGLTVEADEARERQDAFLRALADSQVT